MGIESREMAMPESLQQLAENIWIFPRDRDASKVQPNVGVICTATQTVLIDSGNSPSHARRIQAALDAMQAPPVSHIIYTHHHWDHTFGACVFGAPVIAHDLCQELLTHLAEQLSKLQESAQHNPLAQAIEREDAFRYILPTTTFARTMTLPLDGLTLELEHVGGAHAADSIVVRIKERGVMFLGDCYYPPPAYQQSDKQKTNWSMLASFIKEPGFEIFVEGHSSPLKGAEFLKRLSISLMARI